MDYDEDEPHDDGPDVVVLDRTMKHPTFAAPIFGRIGDYWIFLVRRGRIPQKQYLRQGGVWQPTINARTRTEHLLVSCPRRACKAIIEVERWLFRQDVDGTGIARQDNDTCVVCSRCMAHYWFALKDWTTRDQLRKAIR